MIQRYYIQWKSTSADRQITHDVSLIFFITPSRKQHSFNPMSQTQRALGKCIRPQFRAGG